MNKNNIGNYLLAFAFGIIIVLLFTRNSEKNEVPEPIIPKIVVDLENQNAKEKEIINNRVIEIREIENSDKYLSLKHLLDSLMTTKDTSSFATITCYETVEIQDTIISKQKDVIERQERVIQTDSLVKDQLHTTILQQDLKIKEEVKKGKKKLWRGRGEGAVVGGVVGFILGKTL